MKIEKGDFVLGPDGWREVASVNPGSAENAIVIYWKERDPNNPQIQDTWTRALPLYELKGHRKPSAPEKEEPC